MEWSRSPRRARVRRAAALLAAAGCLVALAGCTAGTAAPAPSATPAVTVVKDLAFADEGGRPSPLLLDACTPKDAKGTLPAVVIVHSGAWSEGTHGDLDWLCTEGAQHGFAAFTVDYRLLPAAFPSQLEDVVSAVDWITAPKQAERFSVDPKRITLLGTSAGGGIVSELLTGVPGSPVPSSRFRGGAVLSPIVDFTKITEGQTAEAVKVALDYAGCTSLDCAKLADVSATLHVDANDPPVFLANSTDELVPLSQAKGFDAALTKAGVRHEFRIADGKDHAEFIAMNHRDIDAAMWTFLESTVR